MEYSLQSGKCVKCKPPYTMTEYGDPYFSLVVINKMRGQPKKYNLVDATDVDPFYIETKPHAVQLIFPLFLPRTKRIAMFILINLQLLCVMVQSRLTVQPRSYHRYELP